MERFLIVGYRGFLGSNIYNYFRTNSNYIVDGIDLDNMQDIDYSARYNYLIYAAGNSKTYLPKQDPLQCIKLDFVDLLEIPKKIITDKIIFFSSSLVYSDNKSQTEDTIIDISKITLYALHKIVMERYIKEFFNNWLILRPTGFWGNGLKKNLLYDLRNNRTDIFYDITSKFDFINVIDFCKIIDILKKQTNQIFNVGSGITLSVSEILSMKNGEYNFKYVNNHIVDNSNLSLSKLIKSGGLNFNKQEIYEAIKNFINNVGE